MKFDYGRVENITRRQNFTLVQIEKSCRQHFKGGYLDFSHLTELEKIYITEIYMEKKKYISSITKNHIIKKIYYFHGVPLKGYVAS